MKKTIKEELETKYIKKDLINDNTLLLYEKVEDNIVVKMRYIEFDKLHETVITTITEDEFIEGDRIRFNVDNTALAVFRKNGEDEVLDTFYNLKTHGSVGIDFLDFLYNMKFKDKVNKELMLIKK